MWNKMIKRPHGIILVTGPTGSVKTTTLYTTLKQLATSEVNVCSVEGPIELVEPSFNQMQIQNNIGLDFAKGVKTLLKKDPDTIMIGEIRDRETETAEMAFQAALTGHLVLSTLHTSDPLKQEIGEGFDLARFRRSAIKLGMRPLNLAGAQKVAKGVTTIGQVLKVAPPPYDG